MANCDYFELFTRVAMAESLGQAAKLLGMSKSQLSKQIKKLEQLLKVDLFSRKGYRLSLTPEGERLLQQTLRLQRELDDTRSICEQFHDNPTGKLKVVVFYYFAKYLIFPRLNDFLSRYPQLQLAIDMGERIPDFDREQVDIAVGFSLPAPNSDEIIQRSLGTTDYILCATPSYLARKGYPKSLDDLKNHQYINHSCRLQGQMKLQSGANVSLQPHFIVNSVSSMIECAKQGIGLVQLPTYMVKDLLATGQLVSILPELQRQNEHVYYYYPKYRYIQPKVRKFIEFFLKEIPATIL